MASNRDRKAVQAFYMITLPGPTQLPKLNKRGRHLPAPWLSIDTWHVVQFSMRVPVTFHYWIL